MKKRGESDISMGTVIFLILNLLFFSIILIFIMTSSNNITFYEDVYSKQVALLIDSSRPGTRIILSNSDFLDIFSRDIEKENIKRDNFFSVSQENKRVTFKFKESAFSGFAYYFFSDIFLEYNTRVGMILLNMDKSEQLENVPESEGIENE